MGIFNALSSAVSGLRAQSFALENISGNIANSQTTGFKRNDTTFADLVSSEGQARTQTSGSVRPLTRSTNSVQGGIEASDIPTNMAINGDGFFLVSQQTGGSGSQPIFSQQTLYTRRGDFSLNKNGYLVNGAGYFLNALPIDQTTGNPSSGVPVPLQLTNDFLPAKGTQSITYRANLPEYPKTANADPDVAGSELLPAALAGGATIVGSDNTSFLANSLTGNTVTSYDANGNPVNVQFRWAKTASSPASWSLYYQTNSNPGATDVAWTKVPSAFTFNSSGVLQTPASPLTISALTVNGKNLGDVKLDFGDKGITQYADNNGTVQVNALSQDGYAAGEVIDVSVNDGGHIVANYSNGQTIEVGRVPLAAFSGEDWLQKLDGGAFAETIDSGPPRLGASGQISGSSNEASNVDIATEFSKLIVTQQAYSANTRIVSTSDEMMQDTLAMKR